MRAKIVTIINNFGEEKFIVRYTEMVSFWIFWTKEVWRDVTFTNSNDPFFYDSYFEAQSKAEQLLVNANPRRQRVVAVTDTKEVTI